MTELTEAATSRYVDIVDNGRPMKLHYNEAGSGPAVIMLHGSGPGASGWANFHRNIGPISEAGYRVLLLDCAGWNKSEAFICTESRPHQIARSVAAVMDELGLETAHVVGNSMGTVAAVDFALSYPQRVDRMVLLGGGGVGPSLFSPMPPEGIKRLQELYADPTIEKLQRMLDVFVYDPQSLSKELIETRLANIVRRPDHLKNWLASWAAHPNQFPDLGGRLGEISAPSLVIWGRDDRFVPLDLGLRYIWGLQNSELHVFSKCGHWAQWEHAERFNALTLDFLRA